MADWLFKEEPDCYNFTQLQKDGSTQWNGVVNNLARKNLRQVKKGDRILYYHTGKEKAVVGIMKAVSNAGPDPASDDPKAVTVKVKPVRKLQTPVPLEVIKHDPKLAGWDLVRLSRLSVMPVGPEQWQRIEELSRG
ncbi:ubiquinol-cytochrome C reductase [Planctomycetaceae bacterium SCGC AG-212-F19]|nr:ubiquinol-cytochrome C reductase [Planctomycetaceae bacterium SCGC AG-212-F19]